MDDLEFEFGGDTTEIPMEGEPKVTEEEKREAQTDETTKPVSEPQDEEEEQEKEEEKAEEENPEEEDAQKKDWKRQALDQERAKRKQAEKELRELRASIENEKNQKEDEEKLVKEKENLKKELLEGDYFDDEVAEKFVNTFGERLLKNQIESERKASEEDFERKFSEFAKAELYQDAENYKPEIKDLMSKGLTMEQAYRAAIPEGRFEQMRKDLEIEVSQRLLNSNEKADQVDIGHNEAKGEAKRTQYTKREQEIAKETGLDVKDVHKRAKVFTLDEMLDL